VLTVTRSTSTPDFFNPKADLIAVQGIGPKTAQGVTDYFRDPRHSTFLQKLFDNGMAVFAPH
jgi:NAD-dependent DNA ligase